MSFYISTANKCSILTAHSPDHLLVYLSVILSKNCTVSRKLIEYRSHLRWSVESVKG